MASQEQNPEVNRILVIDDELGIRQGCQRALEPHGFAVEKAATIQEGKRKLEESHFELVLIDVMMPDGRGIDLIEPIHQIDPDTVCVIITGYATVELAVQAIKAGAYNFISKPFTSDTLLMTVNQGLERRHFSLESRRLKEVEKEAARLVREKEELARLEQYKSEFMRTVAHELRSPVVGAQSLLRTILRGYAGDLSERQKEILSRINERMDSLLDLINDLLTLAASKTFEADRHAIPVPLIPVMHQIVDDFNDIAVAKGVQLSMTAPENDLVVLGTEDGLRKIFANLIGNAIKYTPTTGKVDVSMRDCQGGVEVKVVDTGIGIPQSDLPHLFEEFFRARNARHAGIPGTGLGLSIVKQIVDQFGGRIEVDSAEGRGTRFTVTLQKSNPNGH